MNKYISVQPAIKKQKVFHDRNHDNSDASSSCTDGLSDRMESLVDQLNQTGFSNDGEVSIAVMSIRSEISNRSGGNVSTTALQKLFRSVMLRMGYSLSLMKGDVDGNNLRLLELLVFCMRDAIKSVYCHDLHRFNTMLASEDIEASVILLPQMVLTFYDSLKTRTMHGESTQQAISACVYVMVTLSRATGICELFVATGMKEQRTMEKFLCSLVVGAACAEGSMYGKDDVNSVLCFFQTSTSSSPLFRSLSKLAATGLLLPMSDRETYDSCLSEAVGCMTPDQRVFFWSCTAHSFRSAIPQKIADVALKDLLDFRELSRSNARSSPDRLAGICDFVHHASSKLCLSVIEEIYETLNHRNDHGHDKATYSGILDCLGSCIARVDGPDLVLEITNKWPRLFRFLVHIISTDVHPSAQCQWQAWHQYDAKVAAKAANIAIPILKELFFQQLTVKEKCYDLDELMSALSTLLKFSDMPVVEKALDLLLGLLQDPVLGRRVAAAQSRDLTHALATVASNEIMSGEVKCSLVQAFLSLLTHCRGAHFVSREPKILDFLVSIADDRNDVEGLDRGTVVRSLLRLATNPCDRRKLAKMPGLLSSMIRYVRSTADANQGDDAAAGSFRDEIKEKIFLLAEAL